MYLCLNCLRLRMARRRYGGGFRAQPCVGHQQGACCATPGMAVITSLVVCPPIGQHPARTDSTCSWGSTATGSGRGATKSPPFPRPRSSCARPHGDSRGRSPWGKVYTSVIPKAWQTVDEQAPCQPALFVGTLGQHLDGHQWRRCGRFRGQQFRHLSRESNGKAGVHAGGV